MTIDEISTKSFNNNNKSFKSLKSNETLGIDFTQLIEENGMLNETCSPTITRITNFTRNKFKT